MKITTLTFEKRWNLGDYNHENLVATAGVEENENPSDALKELLAFVRTKGESGVVVVAAAASTTQKVADTEQKVEVKETKAKKEKATKVVVEKEEVSEKTSEVEKEEIKAEEKQKDEPKKSKAKSATPYDPDNNLHKKLVGEFLDKSAPSWRKDTAPAKAASSKMRGQDFQDSEGLILESFKVSMLELLG